MSRLKALGLATVVAAVALPLGMVVAGGPPNTAGDNVSFQSAAWTGKQEARRNWREVPNLSFGLGNVVFSPGLVSVTVSAQMTTGAVKFRLKPEGGPAVPPGPVRFDAKASNSFSWAVDDTCGPGDFHQLQWRKVGKGKATAGKIATHFVWNDPCL